MVPRSVPDARPLAASAHISGYRNSAGQFNAKSSEILAKPSVLFSELFDLRLHSRRWNGPRRLGPGVSTYSEWQGRDNNLTHSAAFRTVARRRERRLNRLMLRMRGKIDHVTAKESEPPVHEFRGWVFLKTPQKCFSVYKRRIGGTVASCQQSVSRCLSRLSYLVVLFLATDIGLRRAGPAIDVTEAFVWAVLRHELHTSRQNTNSPNVSE